MTLKEILDDLYLRIHTADEALDLVEGIIWKHTAAHVAAEREACVAIIEDYKIPVGNSAAGELACEWTYDALMEIRDDIRARGEQ